MSGIRMVCQVTWLYHLNTVHTVRYSDESDIQVFSIKMVTVLIEILVTKIYCWLATIYFTIGTKGCSGLRFTKLFSQKLLLVVFHWKWTVIRQFLLSEFCRLVEYFIGNAPIENKNRIFWDLVNHNFANQFSHIKIADLNRWIPPPGQNILNFSSPFTFYKKTSNDTFAGDGCVALAKSFCMRAIVSRWLWESVSPLETWSKSPPSNTSIEFRPIDI